MTCLHPVHIPQCTILYCTGSLEPGPGPRATRRLFTSTGSRDCFSAREDTEDTFDEVKDDPSPFSPQQYLVEGQGHFNSSV